jgi:hypothetical protein
VGPTVLLRADMDALPVTETTGLAYESRATGVDRFGQTTGIAHACAHDMHVACLMGATRVLVEKKDRWNGTLVALFQPAEETSRSASIVSGLLDAVASSSQRSVSTGLIQLFQLHQICGFVDERQPRPQHEQPRAGTARLPCVAGFVGIRRL